MRLDPKSVQVHFAEVPPQSASAWRFLHDGTGSEPLTPPGDLLPRIVGCPKCARAVHFGVSRAALSAAIAEMSVRCSRCGHTFVVDARKAGSPSY